MDLIQKFNLKVGQQEIMKTRRMITGIATILILATFLSTAAAAAAAKTCGIAVTKVPGKPGQEVTVEVRAEQNPGFTNLAMVLDFDPAKLELLKIDGKNPEGKAYLCGDMFSVNLNWTPGADDTDLDKTRTYPFLVCAGAEEVKGDGVLFTATFKVLEGSSGVLEVAPRVRYIRSNTAAMPAFEDITANETAGGVEILPEKIELSAQELWLREDGTGELTATGAENITWTSSAPEIVAVENGKLTAKAPGTAVITASAGTVRAECSVTVVVIGDLDGDNKLTAKDIMAGLRLYNTEAEELTPRQLCALDLDDNGRVEANEIMTVLDRYNGK